VAESATATGVVAAAADATATTTTHSGNDGSKLVNNTLALFSRIR